MNQKANSTTFLCVRHAGTIWNKEQRHTGSSEIGLAPEAAQQIAGLTDFLLSQPITSLYSSPLQRAQHTIQPFAQLRNLPISIRSELIERHLGTWEGKSPADLLPTHPGYHFPESAYTGDFLIPGAEPLAQLEKRIRQFLIEVHRDHAGEVVALSTHAGIIWTMLHRIVSNSPENFSWPANCTVQQIRTEGNHYLFQGSIFPA